MAELDCEHDYHWYPEATHEAGWRCVRCQHRPGEPPGFAPHLDRERIERKVGGLILDMHEADLIYISNGDHGDHLTGVVAKRCVEAGLFDQYTIVRFIFEEMQPGHAEYWQRISDGIVSGSDPRERCHCGALATAWSNGKGTCSAHMEAF